MICPFCTNRMEEVQVPSADLGHLSINHCQYCMGNWLDKEELLRLSSVSVTRLGYMRHYPQKQYVTPLSIVCPKDRTPLTSYHSNFMSGETGMYVCKTCLGIWAPHRALSAFVHAHQANAEKIRLGPAILPRAVLPILAGMVLIIFASVLTMRFIRVNEIPSINIQQAPAAHPIESLEIEQQENGLVVIIFLTDKPVTSILEYQESGTTKHVTISDRFTTDHRAILQLPFSTAISYRIRMVDRQGNRFDTNRKTLKTGEPGEAKVLQ